MGLASSDLLKIYRTSTSPYCFKETFGNRANILNTDLLLVERGGTKYKCTYGDWTGASLGDTITLNGSSNVSIDINAQDSGGQSADSTAAYDVLSATFTGSQTTGRLYIGLRIRGSSAFYHDFCLAGIQVLQSSGSSFRSDGTYGNGYDWNFNETGTYGIQNFSTTTVSTHSYSDDPSTLSYTSVGSGATVTRWGRASGTSSSHTGAADGIYSPSGYSGGGGSIIPATGTIAQSSTTFYIFTETSGSGYTIGTTTIWLRSPSITVSPNDILRMAYLAVGGDNSNSGLGAYDSDTLYFRFK